jgi:putative addiction module component (TIGR02574 family)
MQKDSLVSEILELSVDERIKLVGDLWDSIAEIPDAVKLTEEEKEILNERIKAYHENPDAGSPWNVIKQKITSRK